MRLVIFFIGIFIATTIYANDLFSITSSNFKPYGYIPVIYTCNGKNYSPELSFSNTPTNAKSLVLILSDPDAPKRTFYHWAIYNIPSDIHLFEENFDPATVGATVVKNSASMNEYSGPCPPSGSTHTYIFTLYALDNTLTLPKNAEAKDLVAALEPHIIAKAELRARYGRY